MNPSMRWLTLSAALAAIVSTIGVASATETATAATAPMAGSATQTNPRDQHPNMPSPHRKQESGILKIANRQARTFTLDCEACSPEARARVYKAPAAMNLRVLDGKRVLVTFGMTDQVQSVHRIDAHRSVSASKKDA
jgi:hypothetical protein